MKISVIVPFYKGISFLDECFESLAEQTYKEFEVILVCDNVEENIEPLVEKYSKEFELKVITLQDKKGVAAARNEGLAAASGDYVYFLDSDDYITGKTLQLLAAKAEETGADLIYGKKIWTWFRKKVLFANYNTDEMNEVEEEDEEGQDTEASDPSEREQQESDGDEDGDSKESSGDEQQEDSSDEEEAEPDSEAKQKMAVYHLISKRKSLRHISVLNILIKRSLIEENKLSFNETLRFLSDYPFVIQLLLKAESYEHIPLAAYLKRNHNDPINHPALSQLKASKNLWEYIEAYRYAIGLIPEDSDLKLRIDKKVMRYCVRYYAPKLRTNHKDPQRKEKFDAICTILRGMDKELVLTKKRYKGRLLKALYNKDIDKAENIVIWHRRKKKLKSFFKNKRALPKYLYKRFFLRTSLKSNWVFCESFFGKSYSDSPKYVYEYLQKNYPGKYRFIWVIDKKGTKIPYPHTKVKRFSIRYCYYLARCKYYIFNGRQPVWIKKRNGNVFLQTWHGTPLKKLVFDLEDINSATPKYKKQTYKQSRSWDYLIAPNKYSSDIFRRCFIYNKVMLETGYPRNDILHYDNKDELAAEIKDRLGIPKDKKIILYAPTWRDDEYYTKGQYKFSLKLDLKLMREKLGKDYVIILRTHYFIADSLDVTGVEDFAYNLSKYDDISELYLISDILITDYSSVFFDYANLKRPMLFFTYDLDKYRDILRGFYIDIEEELPGPLLFTTEEIITAVNNIDKLKSEYQKKYDAFYEKYCSWEDGQASRKVAEAVFQLKGDN